jgi:hypothetical protein
VEAQAYQLPTLQHHELHVQCQRASGVWAPFLTKWRQAASVHDVTPACRKARDSQINYRMLQRHTICMVLHATSNIHDHAPQSVSSILLLRSPSIVSVGSAGDNGSMDAGVWSTAQFRGVHCSTSGIWKLSICKLPQYYSNSLIKLDASASLRAMKVDVNEAMACLTADRSLDGRPATLSDLWRM